MKRNKSYTVSVLIMAVLILAVAGPVWSLDTVITEAAVDLDGERAHVRTGETNLGNLITDMMVAVTDADVAITNGGGIRASVSAGPVTMENILEVHPFSNVIVTIEMTGAQIVAALEHGVSQYPEHWGGFPHVSGLAYVFDPDQPAGSRIQQVLYNGAPIDRNARYIVATNDFLAAGGDGFAMMEEASQMQEFMPLDAAMIQMASQHNPLYAEVEGRIITQ